LILRMLEWDTEVASTNVVGTVLEELGLYDVYFNYLLFDNAVYVASCFLVVKAGRNGRCLGCLIRKRNHTTKKYGINLKTWVRILTGLNLV